MRSVAVLALAALLVAGGLSAPVAGQSAGDGSDVGPVTLDVYVQADGDARWRVSVTVPINSSNESAAFASLADQFENGSDPPGFDVGVFQALASRGSERTGRSMEITDVDRHATVIDSGNNSTGVLALTFTWTNFAETEGAAVHVGDAFVSWSLGPDQRLRIHPPPNYAITEWAPPVTRSEDSVLTWVGEQTFQAGHPEISYTRGLPTTDTDTRTPTANATTGTPSTGPGDGRDGDGGGWFDPGLVVAIGGAIAAGAVLAYALTHRDDLPGGAATGDGGGGGGDGTGPPPAAEASGDAHGPDGTDAAETGGAAGGDMVDPELLSDEERVERLLRENGGRMKQADIVTETGWSNAKVSQLLSGMDEEGRIEKLRIGRENLISLPGADEIDTTDGE